MTKYRVQILLVLAVLVVGLRSGPFLRQQLLAAAEVAMQGVTETTGSYASVNGLNMYYEIHGSGEPLVLLHGGLSTIEVDFGSVLPSFAETRQIIAIEQQAHGHTADIDRPLTYEQMADDTAALLQQIGVEQADFLGYSIGSGVALQVAIRHPEMVRKLVLVSSSYNSGGLRPGILAGIMNIAPEAYVEAMEGSPFQQAYARVAPNPENWQTLIEKTQQLDGRVQDWLPSDIQGITAPALIVIGDSDIIRLEHAVEMFSLFGGDVEGVSAGLPNSQLAILPGTTHLTVPTRVDWLVSMITAFLDAPMSS
jgi:pimeloyl-ACP methyl ester carboxylesterase